MIDWQPIETAPKDKKVVLLFVPYEDAPGGIVYSGYYDHHCDGFRKAGSLSAYTFDATHWAEIGPLPVPPAPKVEGWQPIATAPKDGTEILVKVYGQNTYLVVAWDDAVIAWDDGDKTVTTRPWSTLDGPNYYVHTFSHWA